MKKIVITGGLGYIGSELCKIYSGEARFKKIVVTDIRFVSERVKQLREGDDAQVRSRNKEVVTALREIAAGKVKHAPISEYDSEEF